MGGPLYAAPLELYDEHLLSPALPELKGIKSLPYEDMEFTTPMAALLL